MTQESRSHFFFPRLAQNNFYIFENFQGIGYNRYQQSITIPAYHSKTYLSLRSLIRKHIFVNISHNAELLLDTKVAF